MHGISIHSVYVQMAFFFLFYVHLVRQRAVTPSNRTDVLCVSGAKAYYQWHSVQQLLCYGSRGKLSARSLSSHHSIDAVFSKQQNTKTPQIQNLLKQSSTCGYNYSFCFVSIYRWSRTEPDLLRFIRSDDLFNLFSVDTEK